MFTILHKQQASNISIAKKSFAIFAIKIYFVQRKATRDTFYAPGLVCGLSKLVFGKHVQPAVLKYIG